MMILLVWLLMAGVAGAESWNDGCNACIGQRNGMYHCTAMALHCTMDIQTTCEQKMEAAMEAMEPYSFILDRSYEQRKEAVIDRNAAFLASKLWAEAKQCWKRQRNDEWGKP